MAAVKPTKLVPTAPLAPYVPDDAAQLRASRAYGKVMEANTNALQAQQQLQRWQAAAEAAVAEYVAVVKALAATLPPAPEGKRWADQIDTATRELRFTLEDA